MKILALELSSGLGSIAFLNDEDICFSREFANDRKHSGLFFENLRECVEQFGRAQRIVVGLGPGSYAGTRIAIAAAIGLQAIANAELIGVPSFCALPTKEKEYVVMGDARRQSFWFARMKERQSLEGPTLFSGQMDFTLPIFSAEILPAFPAAILIHPSAALLATIGSTQFINGPLEPIYLREPHITRPRAA